MRAGHRNPFEKGGAEIHPLLLGPLDAKRNEGSGLSTGMETFCREQAISQHLGFAGPAITLPMRPGLRSSSLLGDLPLASIGRMASPFPCVKLVGRRFGDDLRDLDFGSRFFGCQVRGAALTLRGRVENTVDFRRGFFTLRFAS